MLPDVEQVVCAHLAADLTAAVGTRTPADTSVPWARVNLIDVQQAAGSRALHLLSALVQIDCYAGKPDAGSQEEAADLALAVAGSLHTMPDAQHEGAVVTSVRVSWRALPDTDFSPPRERYLVSATVVLHP